MSHKVEGEYGGHQIEVLEGLEAVRKRFGMYIGSNDSNGLHHLVQEIVDNSIDEALAGYCTKIDVVIQADGSISIQDNGRGIPTDIHPTEGISSVEVVLTKLHAGGKFGGGGYKISGGLHGVGISVVNALSEWLVVEVSQKGKVHRQEFARGIPQTTLTVIGETDATGTKVTFYPDATIFEVVEFDYNNIAKRLKELAYLNKGVELTIADKREGKEREDSFHFEGGIAYFVNDLNKNKTTLFAETLHFEKNYENGIVEVAFQYNDGYNEQIVTFANNIRTEDGGTHLDGFRVALTKAINDAGRDLKIIKENDASLSGEDVREGIVAVISVKLEEPYFEGQTKTKLGNTFMRTLVNKATLDFFATFLEENPSQAKALILRCITAQKAREAARNARDLTRRKGVLEGTTLPGKLSDCSEKRAELCEIYIVEGDSAGGTAKGGRDSRFQAVLPLRGKILNVEKARLNRILENQEIKSMITAFGCGMLNDCDLNKLRYNRIICMTDADVDGSHIRILLLTFFFRFMRPLIENGHVYIARPPLFKVTKGKNITYLYSDEELENYRLEHGEIPKDGLQRYKGLGEMDKMQLWETTMNPATRTLMRVSMKDAIQAEEMFSILMGERPELRRQFIEDNATLVQELDI